MTEDSARILAALFYGLGLPAVGAMHDRPDLTVTDNGVRLLADYSRGCNHD